MKGRTRTATRTLSSFAELFEEGCCAALADMMNERSEKILWDTYRVLMLDI